MFPAILIYQSSFEKILAGGKQTEVFFMTCLDNLVLCVGFGSHPAGQVGGTFWQTSFPMCISILVPVPVVSCPSGKTEKGSKGMKEK